MLECFRIDGRLEKNVALFLFESCVNKSHFFALFFQACGLSKIAEKSMISPLVDVLDIICFENLRMELHGDGFGTKAARYLHPVTYPEHRKIVRGGGGCSKMYAPKM